MSWTIKKANAEDRDGILTLLKESFSGYWTASQAIYSPEFWDWLYKDNPGGQAVTFIAESGGKVVGHFPNVLERIKIGKNFFHGGMVLHLATHADYRKQGIFKNLGKASIEELTKSNIPFSLAFPNDKSRPGFIEKLGFSPILSVPLLIKPLNIKNILKKIIKKPVLPLLLYCILSPAYHLFFNNTLKGGFRFKSSEPSLQAVSGNIRIEKKDEFEPEFNFLWKKAIPQADVMVPRDMIFLNWRFKLRPGRKYQIYAAFRKNELTGYIVTREADIFSLKAGIVMDYLVEAGDDASFETLVNAVMDDFKKQGMDICVAGCLKSNLYYKTLKKYGFMTIPERINPRKLILVGRANKDIPEKEMFMNGKNWFITFADWDTF
jgi:predicted N-acetyltransferase YhbS